MRVLALPRREAATPELVEALSMLLRKPGSSATLRPAQAEALVELVTLRGLVAPMRVGSGKTLVTMLAPTLLAAQRPLLLLPASLVDKTKREFAEYFPDWHVRLPRIMTYESLGHPAHELDLVEAAPDLLMLDEAHRARNLDAACTRRIKRYRDANPDTVVACLSGTLITDALMDHWHYHTWALRHHAPVPLRHSDAERWAKAVDKGVPIMQRVDPGPLAQLPGGFHEWLRTSRGIVPSAGKNCDASIELSRWRPTLPPALRETIEATARSAMRPDGELLDEWELPDCLCQLAQGFYYRWDPEPPRAWLVPRRAWRAYVRAVLDEQLDGFDSESQVVSALDGHGDPPAASEGRYLLAAWRAVRDTFEPNPVPVWLDDAPLRQAADRRERTLIWTRHRAAGERIATLGVPWYPGGTNPEPAAGKTIALSIGAHGTGKNLQAWHRNLVLVPPADPDIWEQLIGRTHRAGQRSDVVYVEVIDAIEYHGEVLRRARSSARATSKASGFDQKLVEATWV